MNTRGLKAGAWALGLFPLARLGWRVATEGLGANPIEAVNDWSGWWGLTLLTITLAVTPVRRLTGRNELIKVRRTLGLFAFTYVTIHFLNYLVLDQFFAWSFIVEDITERPYILAGFTAFLILTSLAVTSTRGWIRRLGRRWQQLHRLVYLAGGLGVLHYLWQGKQADTRAPMTFGLIVMTLLALRLGAAQRLIRRFKLRRRRPAPGLRPAAQPPRRAGEPVAG
ncbi:MAG: sulfite oxidase heme-binding subunit YedZ [Gemmatimonadota bacterium]